MVKVATPDELTFAVPSRVSPLKKLTVPFETPRGAGLTVAVSVISLPWLPDSGRRSSAVVVGAPATVIASPDEVEVAKAALPEYTAVIEFVPAGRLEVVKVATPDEFTFAVPSSVLPLKKLTVPAGVPVGVGVTVAVRVTGCSRDGWIGRGCERGRSDGLRVDGHVLGGRSRSRISGVAGIDGGETQRSRSVDCWW